ncbi:MAG: DMT family transporter [Actinomycetota bacterium]
MRPHSASPRPASCRSAVSSRRTSSAVTTWAVTVIAVVLDPPSTVTVRGVVLLVIGGLVAPGLARWASITGLSHLGPSVAVPIQHGAHPLFAVIGATLLLQETVAPPRFLGVAAIIVGGVQLSRRPATLAVEGGGSEAPNTHFRPGIIYPLMAGAAYAVSNMLIKEGLNEIPFPTFGAFLGTGVSLLLWIILGTRSGKIGGHLLGRELKWFYLAGACVGIAFLTLNRALQDGDVSLVSPIIASQPLAVLLLSHMFLKGIDTITWQTIAAALLVVAGAILVVV